MRQVLDIASFLGMMRIDSMRYCVMYEDAIRLVRLDAGLCPLHDNAFQPVTGLWVICSRRDCGILGFRRLDGGVDLAPGWRFLCERIH